MAISTENIIKTISQSINAVKPAALPIPPPLILTGGFQRKGLSARDIAKSIITRQQEAGAPIGALPSGAESVTEKMERIRIEEIIRALTETARVTTVLPAGIPTNSVGVCPAGAVVTQGFTSSFGIGTSIIQ